MSHFDKKVVNGSNTKNVLKNNKLFWFSERVC